MAPSARATAMAIELDRLLGARDDASGTRAVRSVEHAPDVSRAALFGTTRGDENASRMPDAFYACGDALVMSHDAVVGVRRGGVEEEIELRGVVASRVGAAAPFAEPSGVVRSRAL